MKQFFTYAIWLAITLTISTFLGDQLLNYEHKTAFVPNDTTHGHYQIEMQCSACHDADMKVQQDACLKCHQQELKDSQDSHPGSKFNDPRNFEMVAKLDGRRCITCHTEHSPHTTGQMGLTLPEDYCFACHDKIGEERESHKNLDFKSCSTAGCHNYHDNRALYEDFLLKHFDEPAHLSQAKELILTKKSPQPIPEPDFEGHINPTIRHDWSSTAHAKAKVNCKDCHQPEGQDEWTDKVAIQTCQDCHTEQSEGFLAGKHGMRLAVGLSPMTPGQARLPMKASAAHDQLNCISCHSDHRFDTRRAAVDACLNCHNDQHSLNYRQSPHFKFLQIDHSNHKTDKGVSCATCHMPRIKKNGQIITQHNQNDNLRPNEKMVRSACIKCHGLQFSLDALADPNLILNNFNHAPEKRVESLDWAKQRERK